MKQKSNELLHQKKYEGLIPKNNSTTDYHAILTEFVQLVSQNNPDIESILLVGSYARGEASSTSDVDLYCIFKEIDEKKLAIIGDIVKNVTQNESRLEFNPQCFSINEFQSLPFSRFINPSIVYFESVHLFGSFPLKIPTKQDIEQSWKGICAETLLSIRHYMSSNESSETINSKKITTFVLKPLIATLKLKQYLIQGYYPNTLVSLETLLDEDYTILLKWSLSPELLQNEIKRDYVSVLTKLHQLAASIFNHE